MDKEPTDIELAVAQAIAYDPVIGMSTHRPPVDEYWSRLDLVTREQAIIDAEKAIAAHTAALEADGKIIVKETTLAALVQIAATRSIDEYPADGTEEQIAAWVDRMTAYNDGL